METKSSLRQYCRERRREISLAFRERAARQCLSLICQEGVLSEHQTMACYLAQEGEFDTTPLIYHAWKNNQTVCLPVICQDKLVFKPYKQADKLKSGPYGILEPDSSDTIQPDLVFLPLVAFDRSGHRLGMGKGFYDKTFQVYRPTLVGVAYACQEVDCLPVDAWDVPLDAVVTEVEFIRV